VSDNELGAGSVVAGRYQLHEPAPTDLTDAVSWQATDTVLDRSVRLTLLGGTRAQAALDAARRAALVSGTGIAQLLDVGTTHVGDDVVMYTATEPFTGRTLADIVSTGLLGDAQARAIVGEAATALADAAVRGVRHGALRPEAIRIDEDRLVVTGLGVDGALAGAPSGTPEGDIADARGLAALLYYCLTARWALDSLDGAWMSATAVRPERAAMIDNLPTPLSSLVRTVDSVVDSVVNTTLAGTGPASAAAVAEALRPWVQVDVAAEAKPLATGLPVRQSVFAPGHTGPVLTRSRIAPASAAAPAFGRQEVVPAALDGQQPPTRDHQQPPPGPTFAPMAFVAPAAGGVPAALAPVALPTAAPTAEPSFDEMPQSVPAPSPASRPAPSPAPGPAVVARPRGVYATPVVVGLLVVGLVVGVGWAWRHVSNPFAFLTAAEPTPTQPVVTSSPGETDVPEVEEPTIEVRPVILEAQQVGPNAQGCTGEQQTLAPLTFDGDPSGDSAWYTCLYTNPVFQNGVGLVITLEQPAPVTGIRVLTDGNGGVIQIRAPGSNPDANPAAGIEGVIDGEILAEGAISPTTALDFTEPLTLDSFVVWITELPTDARGQPGFRVRLYEITVQ
jgi:hypothetical protein